MLQLRNNGHNDNYIANIRDDCVGTIDSRFDTFSDAERSAKTDDKSSQGFINESVNENINIFRYKFTDDFTCELFKFSKIHQYDHRKDFKEAWKTWLQENDEIADEEIRRLKNLGYQGNIEDKMFKSARYYFRKKSDQKREPKQRRAYISVNRELLNAMDRHISENIYLEDYQPKNGFESFCKDNETILQTTVNQIVENGVHDKATIDIKIKKTYKNRYFLLTNK